MPRFTWLFIFIFFCGVVPALKMSMREVAARDFRSDLKVQANAMASALPYMVDEVTRLDAIQVGDGLSLYYYLTILGYSASELQGQIDSYDQFVILLKNAVNQMIYKHAISTIVPAKSISIPMEDHDASGGEEHNY